MCLWYCVDENGIDLRLQWPWPVNSDHQNLINRFLNPYVCKFVTNQNKSLKVVPVPCHSQEYDRCEVTMTFEHQNGISSSLSVSGHLCQFWRYSFKALLRYDNLKTDCLWPLVLPGWGNKTINNTTFCNGLTQRKSNSTCKFTLVTI